MTTPRLVFRTGEYRCATCANKVVQKSTTTMTLHAKGAVSFTGDGRCKFRCRTCGGDVDVPFALVSGGTAQGR